MDPPRHATAPAAQALRSARLDLDVARRLAAWDPDAARDGLCALIEMAHDDDALLAEASEVLGKVFAVTGAWPLASLAYQQAAATRDELGAPAHAASLRALVASFPLTPFATDQDALASELAAIDAAQRGDPALTQRRLVELRRALSPRPITGRLEASFALAPEDLLLLVASVASTLDAVRFPARTTAAWSAVLAGDAPLDDRYLLASSLCRATPALVPRPGVVSRLLGRTRLEAPPGLRLAMLAPGAPPEHVAELASALIGPTTSPKIGVIHGDGARGATAAAIADGLHCPVIVAHVLGDATPDLLAEAGIEARLFDGLLAVDLDEWRERGVDLVGGDAGAGLATYGPLFALAGDDPAIAACHRAFTLQLGAGAVGSAP